MLERATVELIVRVLPNLELELNLKNWLETFALMNDPDRHWILAIRVLFPTHVQLG